MKKNKNIKINNGMRSFLLFGITVSLFSVIGIANVSDVFADESTIDLTITTEEVSLDISPMSPNGTFASSEAMNIYVSTDHSSGYTLFFDTESGTENGQKLFNGSNFINTIPNMISESEFSDASNSQYSNMWGYKPSKIDGYDNDEDNYLPAPLGAAEILDTTSSSSDEENEYTISLGARIAPDLPKGSYSNAFVIIALPNMLAYSISYNENTDDEVSNMPEDESGIVDPDGSVSIGNSIPVREGWDFVGWCDDDIGGETVCDGRIYYPGDELEIDQTGGDTNIQLYAIWETTCPANNICYKDNGAGDGYTMPNQSVESYTDVTLYANNYENTGYGFAGWSTEPIKGWSEGYVSSEGVFEDNLANAVSDGKVYGPNDNYPVEDVDSAGQKLYAIWVPVAKTIDNEDYSMHGLSFQTEDLMDIEIYSEDGRTIGTLGNQPVGYVTALRDERDDEVYAIAKLADGNYWMIENLRLESENTVGEDNEALAQGYAVSASNGSFVGLADSEDETFGTEDANSLYYSVTQSGTATMDLGEDASTRFPRYNNSNVVNHDESVDPNVEDTFSYGNYYTWAASVANVGIIEGEDPNEDTIDVEGTSICPKGWKLPTGAERYDESLGDYVFGNYGQLDIALGGNGEGGYTNTDSIRWRAFPNNFIYSGYVNGQSGIEERGVGGYYWSSTSFTYNAYNLYIMDDWVNPISTEYKTAGGSIRCISEHQI